MVCDFDIRLYLDNLRENKPPYKCPLIGCGGRTYRSYAGIQAHMQTFNHNTLQNLASIYSQNNMLKSGAAKDEVSVSFQENSVDSLGSDSNSEPHITYDDMNKVVMYHPSVATQFTFNFDQQLTINWKEASVCEENIEKSRVNFDSKLPELKFTMRDDLELEDAPPMPNNYIRYIEKSADQLEDEFEYDMDEEDAVWLSIVNKERLENGYNAVSEKQFEMLMDRFEKESCFQSQTTLGLSVLACDEEAVCAICMDGVCDNSNAILFCDMCNLAIHQECYGVPYIPEGSWMCRRCLMSPSCAVECVLCPNKGGAFKQTDDARWCHVVCALWVPEVCFANTVFLEPIDSIERIPAARWKLPCYICKQRNKGACIQCHKTNCYTAFHVTCAQQAGLHMKIDAVRSVSSSGSTFCIRKEAYCDIHTPVNSDAKPQIKEIQCESSAKKAKVKAESRKKMRQARKVLAQKRCAVSVVSVPTIPPKRIRNLASLVSITHNKNVFVRSLLSYWTLKRHARNGVPLLRRLQVSHSLKRVSSGVSSVHGVDSHTEDAADVQSSGLDSVNKQTHSDFKEHKQRQFIFWQKIRQDLEKVRLLCELVRKREKKKRDLMKVFEKEIRLKISPLQHVLINTLDQICYKDTYSIFSEPVNVDDAPNYLDIIKNPMDLSRMCERLKNYEYKSIDHLQSDFRLMISNCIRYNRPQSIYYKAAVRLRSYGNIILKKAKDLWKEITQGQYGHKDHPPSSSQHSVNRSKDSKQNNDINQLDEFRINQVEKFLNESVSTSADISRSSQLTSLKRANDLLKVAQTVSHSDTRTRLLDSLESKISHMRKEYEKYLEKSHIISHINPTEVTSVGRIPSSQTKLFTSTAYEPTSSDTSIQPQEVKGLFGEASSNKLPSIVSTNFTFSGCNIDTNSKHFTQYRNSRELEDVNLEQDITFSSFTSLHKEIDNSSTDDSLDNTLISDQNFKNTPLQNIQLQPLDLVWAKTDECHWFPALIINPDMPKTGYFYNGIPIPVPPDNVLSLRKQGFDQYLILFFDTKRTWQWVEREYIEPLGVDTELDQKHLNAPKRPSTRKMVSIAYEKCTTNI